MQQREVLNKLGLKKDSELIRITDSQPFLQATYKMRLLAFNQEGSNLAIFDALLFE